MLCLFSILSRKWSVLWRRAGWRLHRILTVSERPFYNRGMPRQVILGFGISIDGYIARRNGAIDFLTMDKEGETVMADFFAKIDTTIMGRKIGRASCRERV